MNTDDAADRQSTAVDHVPIVAGWVPTVVATPGVASLRFRHGQEAVFERPRGEPMDAAGLTAAQAQSLQLLLRRLARHGITVRRLVPADIVLNGDEVVLRGTTRPERSPGPWPRARAWRRARVLVAPFVRPGEPAGQAAPGQVAPGRGAGQSPAVDGAVESSRPGQSWRWVAAGCGVGALIVGMVITATRPGPRPAPSPVDPLDATAASSSTAGPARLSHEGALYGVGDTGDVVVVGDWDGDGERTPAVLRPATGAVYRWDGWPGSGPGVAGRVVARVSVAGVASAGAAAPAGAAVAGVTVTRCDVGDRPVDAGAGGDVIDLVGPVAVAPAATTRADGAGARECVVVSRGAAR